MPDGFVNFENVPQCPVCGSSQTSTLYTPGIACCDRCQVIFRSIRPTQDDIKRSYDSGGTYEDWTKQDASRQEAWKTRLGIIQKHIQTGHLLDVGVGDGRFLDFVKTTRLTFEGTELSDDGGSRAKSRGYTIHQGQLLDIDFGSTLFDAITMWHVLEHVPNPGAVLDKVYSLLKPGGFFFVAVPNEENTLFRNRIGLRRRPNPLGDPTWGHEIHLTHFQPKTLRHSLRNHGYEVIEFGVDDVYVNRNTRSRIVLNLQKTLNTLLNWHFSMAMYCVCRRPENS